MTSNPFSERTYPFQPDPLTRPVGVSCSSYSALQNIRFANSNVLEYNEGRGFSILCLEAAGKSSGQGSVEPGNNKIRLCRLSNFKQKPNARLSIPRKLEEST